MGGLKRILGDIVYGLHSGVGITAPPPEKRPMWFFFWLGASLFFLVFTVALCYFLFSFLVDALR